MSNPKAFAIDWISGNMYFSSSSTDRGATISVAKLDGVYRTEILGDGKQSNTPLVNPSSLAVHPVNG